jgi:hypothetical protein
MTPEERDRYWEEIEDFLRNDWSHRQIAAHFSRTVKVMTKHIEIVRNKYRGTDREIPERRQGAITTHEPAVRETSSYPYPAVSFRQVPVNLGADGKPIKLEGGRLTTQGGPSRVGTVIPHPESNDWRLENVAPEQLRQMTPADLIPRMIRVSPEMSRALYDYLRIANPGWTLKAVKPNTDLPDLGAQEWCDFFIRTLNARPGKNAETTFNTILSGIFVRGALFFEVVLSPKDKRTFVDIVTPDPYTVRFRVADDPMTGSRGFELVQGTDRKAPVLNRPTIKYIPVDPVPDSPYGTSPLAPGLFPSLFIITMLQDARRVVAQQGWPRLDIMVKVAEIIATMTPADQKKPEVVRAYVQKAVDDISNSYSQLDPDQAWVHSDTVEFGDPIGAIGHLEGVGSLFDLLERMAVRAMKSMPLLFGMPEGVSEANANRQWEVHVTSIKAMQKIAEEALSSGFTLCLEANGVAAQAKFKFDEMRAIEELREAQTLFQKGENAQMFELLGYMEHDEASMYAVGHPAAATPIGVVGDEEPEEEDTPEGTVAAGDTGDEDDIQGDDGAKRDREIDAIRTILESRPETSIAVAYAMHHLARLVPKIDPKGGPKRTGDERITVDATDFRIARRDFNYRVEDTYRGILDADPIS